MKILHAIWGLVSIALAVGINRQMAPRVDRTRDATELATPTGQLRLETTAAELEIPLVTVRPLVQDFEYPFGKRIEVRELTLRSAGATDPEMEVFLDLSKTGATAASRSIGPWLGRRLAVLPAAFGGKPRSRLRIGGKAEPLPVVEGALTLDGITLLGESESGMQRSRVRGELVLTLMDGGQIQQARGRLEAVVIW